MSTMMVLQTESNEMLGFILFASEKSVFSELGWDGHCIFTGAPKDPALFENALCQFLQDNKNIEFNAQVISSDKGFTLIIKRLLTAELNLDLKGFWLPNDNQLRGHCFAPEKSAS